MSKTHVYERFDLRALSTGDMYVARTSDGEWVKAEDAINRESVLNGRIRTLEMLLQDTKRAALAGMDAAKSTSTIQLELAEKARAESSPEALASERAANALLTEENERLQAELAACREAVYHARMSPKIDAIWVDAVGDPLSVAAYVRAVTEQSKDTIAHLAARLEAMTQEGDEWKAKHDDVVARARKLIDAVSAQFGSDVDPQFSTPWPWPVSLTGDEIARIQEKWQCTIRLLSGYSVAGRLHYTAEKLGTFGAAFIRE